MSKITLEGLFQELDRCDGSVPVDVLCDYLRRLDVTRESLGEHVRFVDEGYCRNLVHLGPGYAALVLCWRAGQSSPIHDHRGSACGLRVIAGTATEIRYRHEAGGPLVEAGRKQYESGEVCGTYDSDTHVMLNAQSDGQDLITLHVYTPPMHSYYTYSADGSEMRACQDAEVLAEERRRAAAAISS